MHIERRTKNPFRKIALNMLQQGSFYDPGSGQVEFGEADNHNLRALFLIATGMEKIRGDWQRGFENVVGKTRISDPHCRKSPPWRS